MTATKNRPCAEGGAIHTWDARRPLDNLDLAGTGRETLCYTRTCLRCGRQEAKPYGGHQGWKPTKVEVQW
jgi:hypothetical protein